MGKENPIIAIVSESEIIETVFRAEFASSNAIIQRFSNLKDFSLWCRGQRLNGVLIDFNLTMKASEEIRKFLNMIQEYLPVCRIRINAQGTHFSGQLQSKFFEGPELVRVFVQKTLNSNSGRFVRKLERVERIWNVEILDGTLGSNRFITKDLSVGGFFLISTDDVFKVGQKLTVRILELETYSPIEVEIRWVHKWGNLHSRTPGFGVQILNIDELQLEKMNRLLGFSKPKEIDVEELAKLYSR